jgi:hypothetical protein
MTTHTHTSAAPAQKHVPPRLLRLLHQAGWQQPLPEMRGSDFPSWLSADCQCHLFVYLDRLADGQPCVIHAPQGRRDGLVVRRQGSFDEACCWLQQIMERGHL